MTDHAANVPASPETAAKQRDDGSWPKPGDEGYVHPDGSPQSARQLEDNKRAAADRAAAGSTVHGAPAATPGPQLADQAAAAVKRAEDYSGPTAAEAREGVTEFVKDKSAEAAEDVADRGTAGIGVATAVGEVVPADQATQRTVTTAKGKTTR